MLTRLTAFGIAGAVGAALLAAAPAPATSVAIGAEAAWLDVMDAWDAGHYPDALRQLQVLLGSAEAADYLERAALLTGELYRTIDVTTDGRNPSISASGRYVAFETGPAASPSTTIVRIGPDASAAEPAVDFDGGDVVFAPDAARLARIRPPQSAEWTAAVQAATADGASAAERGAAQAQLGWLLARDGQIVVQDLEPPIGAERVVATGVLLKSDLTWGAGGALFFVGADPTNLARSDVYRVSEGVAPRALTTAPGPKSNPIIDPAARAVVYQTPAAPTFRQPLPDDAGGGRGRGAGGGRGGRGGRGNTSYTILDVVTGRTRSVGGSGLTMSADGSTVAWVARDGETYTLHRAGVLDATSDIVRTGAARIEAPALSPDGTDVAYQLMTDTDWEIYVSDRGGVHRRLTRDIQHDVLPRFLTSTHLVGLMGEARHRRSQIYDLATGARTRLFANNTIRTISPEYAWVPSADGRRLVVQADRDGDTVSTERGIYVVDLSRRVSVADVLDRVNRQLAAETDLRDRMTRAFAPIAEHVRSIVGTARANRIYAYEKALFDFDSKHVSQPGNMKAIEYLERTYRSFGYDPVLQWFSPAQAQGNKTANIVSTLRGTENPDLIYVVSSHFDSVAVGPGADDDTSGTAALLETARILSGTPLPATVVFASFTGEEAGLLGSREFVRLAARDTWNVVGALNNDMVGWAADAAHLDNTIRYSNAGIKDVQHGAAFLFTDLVTYDAKYYRSTDAAAFYEAWGDIVGGIGSHPVLANPNYHQPTDFLETMNHRQITETAKVTAATLMYLASSPSRLKGLQLARTAGGVTVSWTPSPERGVTRYIVAYGPASDPLGTRVSVAGPRATLPALPAGTEIAVKAVNARGLEGWDWARGVLQ